ncbi:MAG: Lrp/AsnC ligand binding domain-containing protein [Candidatus Methanofastidiosia archaeon]
MSVVALIEIRAEKVSPVREELVNAEFVEAFYELVGKYNVGIIINVENKQDLFNTVTSIRALPGVEETRTHLIQDGVVF